MAEGVVNKHDIFVSSAECKPEIILQVCRTAVLTLGKIFTSLAKVCFCHRYVQ